MLQIFLLVTFLDFDWSWGHFQKSPFYFTIIPYLRVD